MYPSPAGASREAVIGVADASGVAAARRRAAALTREAGFGEAEAGRVAIVVTEAATNLLKHGNGGEILLQAFSSHSIAGLEILALDRGKGIAPSRHAEVFEPFARGRDGHQGAGLGLAICRGFVEANGGTIRLQSTPGSETSFAVSFPLAPQPSRVG